MSAAGAATARRPRRDELVALVVGFLLLVLVAVLALPDDTGVPLDPRSTGPSGTGALVETLRGLGVDVEITGRVPDRADTTVLVLEDHLTSGQREDLTAWVADGGRLVLTDVASPLNPASSVTPFFTSEFGEIGARPECPLLDGYVEEVRSAAWVVLGGTPATTATCFPFDDGHGLLVVRVGDGTVAVTGVADAIVNTNVGSADNARLLVALLVPDAAAGAVAVLWDGPDGAFAVGEGDTPLLDLVPTGVRAALGLLVAAAVVVGWSRARRHGRPVEEELPVRVPASELVVALGELLQRNDDAETAARRLRGDARADVARLLNVPLDTPPDVLAELAARRIGGAVDAAVLVDRPVHGDDGLVADAAAIARIRRALTGGDHAGAAAASSLPSRGGSTAKDQEQP